MSTSPPSPGEWSLLGTLLALVAEQFAYKSSTDFPLAASDENKAIVAGAIERVGHGGDWADDDATWEDYVAQVVAEEDEIVTFMDWMAGYLGARCQAVAAATGAPLGRGELALIVVMLGVALEDHDEAEESGAVPFAIEESDDNRDILARICDPQSRPPGQENSVPLKAVLIHLTERCEELAAQRSSAP